jgi:outer membrane protein assembly factor BamB
MPRIDGRDICAAAFQRRIACFDHTTGNLTWGRDISSSAGLDMDAQRVYVSDDDGSVHAFARDTGASLWKQDALSRRSLSRPLALGAYVAVADYQGVVHLLKADSGAFAARAVTDGSAVLADPGRVGDALLVQTRNGSLVALGRR